jgi:hypothetical protein
MRSGVAFVAAAFLLSGRPAPAGEPPAAPEGPATGAETLVLPGAANTIGTHSSRWRSDLTLKNPGTEPIEVRVLLLRAGAVNDLATAPKHDYFLLAGETKEIRNVLGADLGASGNGALLVVASHVLFPNNPAGAVVGASLRTATPLHLSSAEPLVPIPAADPTDAGRQVVTGLRHDGTGERGVRGAVGAVNLSKNQGLSLRVDYLDEAGETLASQTLNVPPLSSVQQHMGTKLPTVTARFTRVDGPGPYVAYGTTVDNATEQSTFLYAVPESLRGGDPHRVNLAALVE